MDDQLWWYVARSGGIVAWCLLAASVVWGLALSTRVAGSRPRPNWLLDLHRFLGGLALVFVGVHAIGLVLDSYVHFGPVELLVPFTGTYRPAAVAAGVVGLYLLIAVEITSLLRRRLSKRVWHATHLLSFPLYVLSTVHGITAGTDADNRPLLLAMVLVSVLILALTAARIDQARSSSRPTRRVAPLPGPARGLTATKARTDAPPPASRASAANLESVEGSAASTRRPLVTWP